MSTAKKIATCSYCGTKVVISLSGKDRYELICSSCSAPLKHTKLLFRTPTPPAVAQTLFDIPTQKARPSEDTSRDRNKEKDSHKKRRDSEEYKKDKKYKSRDSENRKWSKDDDDLKKKYKERKNKRRKKPTKKRRGLMYWIREAADEIEDIFD